jgi:hypothetical protein
VWDTLLPSVAPEVLLIKLSALTGTAPEAARRTLLQSRLEILRADRLEIQSAAWPWQIPIGRSRHLGRTCGFQVCPRCLAEGEPYFPWQSQVALFCCCEVHGSLLIDRCPRCLSSIHAAPHGLLAIRRARTANALIEVERCTKCQFDLRLATPSRAPEKLVLQQVAHNERLRAAEQGGDSSEYFTILRHMITLLYGENRGLEGLRKVVARHSGTERVDLPIPYKPDEGAVPFEESDVGTRYKVLSAASWLIDEWPGRFLECCWEAGVEHPALNRNLISVPRFLQVAWAAYQFQPDPVRRRLPRATRKGPGRELDDSASLRATRETKLG